MSHIILFEIFTLSFNNSIARFECSSNEQLKIGIRIKFSGRFRKEAQKCSSNVCPGLYFLRSWRVKFFSGINKIRVQIFQGPGLGPVLNLGLSAPIKIETFLFSSMVLKLYQPNVYMKISFHPILDGNYIHGNFLEPTTKAFFTT